MELKPIDPRPGVEAPRDNYESEVLASTELKKKNTPNIGLDPEVMTDIIDILNVLLADLNVLAVKTRQYYWNVRGVNFYSLNLFFKSLHTQVSEDINLVAERIRVLGGNVLGTMKAYLAHARLREAHRNKFPNDEVLLETLREDFEKLVRRLRGDIEKAQDRGTEVLLGTLVHTYEKAAWMLRASVGG